MSVNRAEVPEHNAAAYLLTKVLGGDAENVQAKGGLLQLGLKAAQLQVLVLTAFPQLLDQNPVQLLGLVSPNRSLNRCSPPTNYSNREQND